VLPVRYELTIEDVHLKIFSAFYTELDSSFVEKSPNYRDWRIYELLFHTFLVMVQKKNLR
jgi:hypothetical protein